VEYDINKDIRAVDALLNDKSPVLLVTHINPDGDAIGSTMAMYHYLKKKGNKVWAMTPNDFPQFLAWVEASSDIIIFQKNKELAQAVIAEAKYIICIDFNGYARLKELGPLLEAANAMKVLIDHHPQPDNGFIYKIHDTKAPATAQLVFKFIKESGNIELLDKTIATCIYTGMMTDTGVFSYNINNSETFRVIADLLDAGIDRDLIYDNVFNNFSHHRMRLMGYCLNEKMVVLPHLHAAYIWLTKKEMEKFSFETGDTEGFVNMPFAIKGINITALFTEKHDHVRVSMRSRGEFDVNKVCLKYFSGGGHKNAAGGESKAPIKEVIKEFEKILESYRNEIQCFYHN